MNHLLIFLLIFIFSCRKSFVSQKSLPWKKNETIKNIKLLRLYKFENGWLDHRIFVNFRNNFNSCTAGSTIMRYIFVYFMIIYIAIEKTNKSQLTILIKNGFTVIILLVWSAWLYGIYKVSQFMGLHRTISTLFKVSESIINL